MQAILHDSTLRLVFKGDLLSTNVDALRQEILLTVASNPGARAIVADLKNTRLVDSKGVNLLIAIFRECESRQFTFAVENPSDSVRRLFALLNLEARFGLKAPALS